MVLNKAWLDKPTSATFGGGDLELDSTSALYFGDSATNGSWRIIRSGNNLVVERREGGVWVEKNAFLP